MRLHIKIEIARPGQMVGGAVRLFEIEPEELDELIEGFEDLDTLYDFIRLHRLKKKQAAKVHTPVLTKETEAELFKQFNETF